MNTLSLILWLILPPCPSEDSNNCKWDATMLGNQTGQSFFVIADYVVLVETK